MTRKYWQESALSVKNIYELKGVVVELCPKCKLIKKMDYSHFEAHWCGSSGPSICSAEFCFCLNRLRNRIRSKGGGNESISSFHT